jgi:hypothetical protein
VQKTEKYKDFYKRLFSGKWLNGTEKHIGYLLENLEGEVVGFLGYLYTKRCINGIEYNFCNVSSWAVKEPYRKYSMDLIYPILDKPEYIYTTFTPNETAIKVWKKLLKAKELEREMYAVLALPSLLWFKNIDIYFDTTIPDKLLNEEERALIQENKNAGATFLLIKNSAGEQCIVSATLSMRKEYLRFAQINYVSEPTFFKKHFKAIVWLLSKRLLTVGCLIDKRFLGSYVPKNAKTYVSAKYYVAKDIPVPENFDHLYSEFYLA